MSYFKYIKKGKGPTKLFVGGVHGNEGETTIKFFKSLIANDFSNGKSIIFNFDKIPYISTLKEEYYSSNLGRKLIAIIKEYQPDFYTELHCYNFKNYENLISDKRKTFQGIPPLIELKNHVLISSVSPLIRKKYFKKETICKTLEIPCLNNNRNYLNNGNKFNKELAIETYLDALKTITKSINRKDYENKMTSIYPKQMKLAIIYAKEIFGKDYPPF